MRAFERKAAPIHQAPRTAARRAAVEADWSGTWQKDTERSASKPVADMNAGVLMTEVPAAGKHNHCARCGITFKLRQVATALAGGWTTAKTATG